MELHSRARAAGGIRGQTQKARLAIGDRALSQGLRLRTERRLLVPTPLATSLAQTWAFGRRQYQLV